MTTLVNVSNLVCLPTGYLFTVDGSRGQLETLSIGDYGKDRNIQSNFLGYSRDLNGVENQAIKPLQEKWVITMSTQYGCSQHCHFCDVPNIKFKGNVTVEDLKLQLHAARNMFVDVHCTDRLNIHFARMGEPIQNPAVFEFSEWLANSKKEFQQEFDLRAEVIHPVLTTSCPIMRDFSGRLLQWAYIKNYKFNGQAGLQLSINSTNDVQREEMFGSGHYMLSQLSEICNLLPDPISRKYCLNFAYSTGYEIDTNRLSELFDKRKFMIKITPIHNNTACKQNNYKTEGGYNSFDAYRDIVQSLNDNGWDTIVFVPSMDEENGLVTCGNLLLGGGVVKL